MTSRGKEHVRAVLCLPYCMPTHPDHTARRIMFMSLHPTHSQAGLYDSTRAHAIMCQYIKAWALSSPTTPGCCSPGTLGQS